MPLLRSLLLVTLFAACGVQSDDDSSDDGHAICGDGEVTTHACVQYASSCVDSDAICSDGEWQCAEGFEYTGEPCRPEAAQPDAGPDASSARDCSEYGGGQAVLAQRCSEDIVEYCIYSDTTQTASWSEIESCAAPLQCIVENDVASCRDASIPQP